MPDFNNQVSVSQLKNDFKSDWIRNGATHEMIDYADKVGKFTAIYFDNGKKNPRLNTTKIRNLYGEIKRIQSKHNFESEKYSFYLLKARFAYVIGRESKQEIKEALNVLFNIYKCSEDYVIDNQTFDNYCNLMEAIIAFHRYYGGK